MSSRRWRALIPGLVRLPSLLPHLPKPGHPLPLRDCPLCRSQSSHVALSPLTREGWWDGEREKREREIEFGPWPYFRSLSVYVLLLKFSPFLFWWKKKKIRFYNYLLRDSSCLETKKEEEKTSCCLLSFPTIYPEKAKVKKKKICKFLGEIFPSISWLFNLIKHKSSSIHRLVALSS